MINLGNALVEDCVVALCGIQCQPVSLRFIQFILSEAVGGDHLHQRRPQKVPHLGQSAGDRRLGNPQGRGHTLARLAIKHPHPVDRKIREIRLFLHHPDRGLDLGPEDCGLVVIIYRRRRTGHPRLIKRGLGLARAALLRIAPVHLIAQDVLGDRQQPC